MTDDQRVLSDAEIAKMQTPLWEQAKAAIDAGDAEAAKALVDRAVAQWASLKDYSINWITTLLTFITDELGRKRSSARCARPATSSCVPGARPDATGAICRRRSGRR